VSISGTDNHVGAWAATITQHQYAGDTVDDLPDYVLVDPFSFEGAYVDGQVPSQLEPSLVEFNLWGTSTAVLPQPERGQLLDVELSLLPAGANVALASISRMRVVEAVLTLVPSSRWPARIKVKATCLLVDLPSLTSALPAAFPDPLRLTRHRLAQIGYSIARSIGLPTTAPAESNPPVAPPDPTTVGGGGGASATIPQTNLAPIGFGDSGRDHLAKWCASCPEIVVAGIITPTPAAAYPTGYGYCGPSTWFGTPIPDPASSARYIITTGDRAAYTAAKLPLRLSYNGSELVLGPAPAADDHTAAVDAGYVETPSAARTDRSFAPNVVQVNGAAFSFAGKGIGGAPPTDAQGYAWQAHTSPMVLSASDAAATGPRVRQLDTIRNLASFDWFNLPYVRENGIAPVVAAPYLPDAEALATRWGLDAMTIKASRMTDADALSCLPKLTPHYPGENGDGKLVRHVTLFNVDPDVRPDLTRMPEGYVVGWRWFIAEGELDVTVMTTPGRRFGAGVTRITVGEVDAATWHAIPAGNIDRNILVSDLTYVDA